MVKYTVTPDNIRSIASKANTTIANELALFLNEHGEKYRVTTSLDELSQFLGQVAVESGGFTVRTENLNYSAKRLMAVWPNRYKTLAFAQQYAHNPQKLANHTYGGRMGNTGANDGWLYIGRGLKQLTGKDNYNEFTKWMRTIIPNCPDFVANPQMVSEAPWCYWSAIWFWFTKKVYLKASDTRAATKAINGGYNGIDERVTYVNRAKKVFNTTAATPFSKKPVKKGDPVLKEYQEKLNRIADLRKTSTFSVGLADGWNGNKTIKAVKAFQKSTGFLKVDGDLGKETREAIDNVLDAIENVVATPIQSLFNAKPVEVVEDVIVQEVPEKLEQLESASKSKTIWASFLAFGTSGIAFFQSGVDVFLQLDPMVQLALIIFVTAVVILLVGYVKDLRKAKKGVEELKAKAEELLKLVE